MTNDSNPKSFSLRRWSQRKLAAARASAPDPTADDRAEPPPAVVATPPVRPIDAAPAELPTADRGTEATEVSAAAAPPAAATPPIESLTIDSDYSAFLGPGVDESLKRAALKQLFRDPRFNVMDGLDVYIDDYTQPDPVPTNIVRQMVQGRYIFDPPKTRVTEAGNVEDVASGSAAIDGESDVGAIGHDAAPPFAAPSIAVPKAEALMAPDPVPPKPAARSGQALPQSAGTDADGPRPPDKPGEACR